MHTTRVASFLEIGPSDLEALRLLTGPSRSVPRGEYVRMQGSADPEVFFLKSGWLASSVTTTQGGRQITKIHLPGDLVGMPSFASTEAAETIGALTDAEIESIPIEAFARIFRDHPRQAAMLFMWSQEERVHLMHQLTLLGRLRGSRRVAGLILSLFRRLQLNNPAAEYSFAVPMTQEDLGDATGMSIVHANRSLRELRERGIATWQAGVVTIHDLDRLAALADAPAPGKRRTDWI